MKNDIIAKKLLTDRNCDNCCIENYNIAAQIPPPIDIFCVHSEERPDIDVCEKHMTDAEVIAVFMDVMYQQ